jgi:hypothetical protein
MKPIDPESLGAALPLPPPEPPQTEAASSEPEPIKDQKIILAAYVQEGTVALVGLVVTIVLALHYARNGLEIALAIAPQLAFIAVELLRVPVAIKIRTNPSRWIKTLGFIYLLCAGGLTWETMTTGIDAMVEPRFREIRHFKADLEEAEQNLAIANGEIDTQNAEANRARDIIAKNTDRATAASDNLKSLPRICGWTKKHGNRCYADRRENDFRANLKAAQAQIDAQNTTLKTHRHAERTRRDSRKRKSPQGVAGLSRRLGRVALSHSDGAVLRLQARDRCD